jgi:DNA-binding response OmpR family regulator
MLKHSAMTAVTSPVQALLSNPSVLVVDASTTSRRMVSYQLKHGGYEVFSAASARQALDHISSHGLPHLAIVTLEPSDREALAFCKAVRQFSELPVLLLSYKDNEGLIPPCLSQYATNCLCKPFSSRELLEHVRHTLRRVSDFSYTISSRIQVDEQMVIDFGQQRAMIANRPIDLTRTESKLLFILVSHSGRTVGSEFLRNCLWPNTVVCKDSLRVYIRNLRKKIEPDPATPRYIITERSLGYRFLRAEPPR